MNERVAPPRQAHTLQCMEIWGGNNAVASRIETPGLDAWVFSRPYEGAVAGGDVHYVSLCGGGILTRIIVADVSGHGASVASFSTALRGMVRKNINTKSQTRLVKELNREFSELALSRRFATAIVATYLAGEGRLTICNAGHPRPFRFAARSGAWRILDKEGMIEDREISNLPLGLDEDSGYKQFALRLGDSDLVILYTDALIEAKNPEDRLLGEEGLLGILDDVKSDDPESAGREILDRIQRYRGDAEPDDDQTLLVLRHGGGPARPPATLGQKAKVYAKALGLLHV